ncbi:MAG: hypothetical protein OEX11_07225 [Nitrosomonas sp.]|nr:hypothetical protein [Nitrosomonas sp.]
MSNIYRFVISFAFLISLPACAENITSQANKFWNEFRIAVKKDDYATLEKMTKFPLSVHGEMDFMPIKKITKDNFSKEFKKLLDQKIYIETNGKEDVITMRDAVVSVDKINNKYNLDRDKHFRVNDLDFVYENKRWVLFRTYYQEE